MPFIDLGEDKLFYAAHDQDARRNLVCVHGAAADHRVWPAGLGDIPDCNTWLPDLPGHGRSGGPPPESLDEHVEAISAFIETLDLDNVVLAGHSMGGAIVQALALKHADCPQALILACTGARVENMDELMELIRHDFASAVERLTFASFAPGAPAALVEAYRAHLLDVGARTCLADFTAWGSFDATRHLHQITQRTLVISGDIDRMTPLKHAQFLEDRMPDARLAVIAPAGHQLPLEQPDDMVNQIRDFMARTHG